MRVFFHAENVMVSSEAVTIGTQVYPIRQLVDARSRRTRHWLREVFELILTHEANHEVAALRHRNGYFIFQLVHAIHAALEARRAERLPLAS
jgi:hypothetical protein